MEKPKIKFRDQKCYRNEIDFGKARRILRILQNEFLNYEFVQFLKNFQNIKNFIRSVK